MNSALLFVPCMDAYRARLARLAESAAQAGLAGVLVAPGADLRYLIGGANGSHERLSALLVPATGDPVVIVPTLERPGWADSPAEAAGFAFETWSDGDDPYAVVAGHLGRGARLAVDDHLPALHVFGLLDALGADALRPAAPLIGEQRSRKDADELAALAAIGAANDSVQARIAEWLIPGRTENEVAADITEALVATGHAVADFVIVGSGANGASPHHEASDKVIEAGEPVVIDIGGPAASGYNSDSTRTYCVGEPTDPEFIAVYDVVLAAQQAGFEAAVAGAPCSGVDAASRAVIERAGYGDFFITRTGHGIGLEVHESPYMVTGNDTPLAPGHVFSIEPGVYLPGRFGVRIEDIVAIGDDGQPLRLNQSPKTWRLEPRRR